MTNWKTSLFALIAAAAGFVAMHPMYTAHWPIVNDIASYIMVGGLAGIGLAAKDSTTHSTASQVSAATVEKQEADQAPGTSVTTVAQTSTQSTKP